MTTLPFLGVCYYPEHWPERVWAKDAEKMVSLGISRVRIGEFAWSRIEPNPGQFEWGWLDRAIETLASAGLELTLGTPTATPPKWLIDAHPDILAHDEFGRPRTFGSRRHYCFSSETYRRETERIVTAIASRYGSHPAIVAWQTDNEYGCHDTVRSYSPSAAKAFQTWLSHRYTDVSSLNEAWGTVFWSQEYRSFDEIELPNLTVTEPNPSHVLEFYRFSSDKVVSYNKAQVDILRQHAPGRPITHNYMGFFYHFDHFEVAKGLDAVGWDSYPIGFLDVGPFPKEAKDRYLRQGHPDIAPFHHDLYRSVGRGNWSVAEQQPGPVNWADHNPAPLPGMVRLWSLEAFAHGAQSVNYFRWRQAPFAQEQMHAGLERPDSQPAPGYAEAHTTAGDLAGFRDLCQQQSADVAIVFSYDAHWLFEAHPQGAAWNYAEMVFTWYSCARRLGLNIDFLSPEISFDGYKLIIVPSLPILTEDFVESVTNSGADFLFGPRTGSKTTSLGIPEDLAPGALQQLIPLKVAYSESLPATHAVNGQFDGNAVDGRAWLDHVETNLNPLAAAHDVGLLYNNRNVSYFTTVPSPTFQTLVLEKICSAKGIKTARLPEDLRLRRTSDASFLMNYGPEPVQMPDDLKSEVNQFILGEDTLPAAGVTAWTSHKEKTKK